MVVDLLIIGGSSWIASNFLTNLDSISTQFTSRPSNPKPGSIPFEFIYPDNDQNQYRGLPDAQTVLITFPIIQQHALPFFVNSYLSSRSSTTTKKTAFILLGTTSIWSSTSDVVDRHSPHDTSNPRASSESAFLSLPSTAVLNLAGLWGRQRDPRAWINRLKGDDAIRNKGSIHLIHGSDVALAILAAHRNLHSPSPTLAGSRWIVTDLRVYDWWDLAFNSNSENPQASQSRILHLLRQGGFAYLPRPASALGRQLDSREFWERVGETPKISGWVEMK